MNNRELIEKFLKFLREKDKYAELRTWNQEFQEYEDHNLDSRFVCKLKEEFLKEIENEHKVQKD